MCLTRKVGGWGNSPNFINCQATRLSLLRISCHMPEQLNQQNGLGCYRYQQLAPQCRKHRSYVTDVPRGAPILHIEAREWSDLFVICPSDANTLAKIVNGICDNLLTSVVRAWDTNGTVHGTTKSIIVAPAMNTTMCHHLVTAKRI